MMETTVLGLVTLCLGLLWLVCRLWSSLGDVRMNLRNALDSLRRSDEDLKIAKRELYETRDRLTEKYREPLRRVGMHIHALEEQRKQYSDCLSQSDEPVQYLALQTAREFLRNDKPVPRAVAEKLKELVGEMPHE